MASCTNLLEVFGKRYRVDLDDHAIRYTDPWYHVIPCKYGHIYPHGDGQLGFASDRRGRIANQVAALPDAEVVQDGDDGMNIVFPVNIFPRVAEIVRPRRKRRPTEKERVRLAEMGRRFWFQGGAGGS